MKQTSQYKVRRVTHCSAARATRSTVNFRQHYVPEFFTRLRPSLPPSGVRPLASPRVLGPLETLVRHDN
eukprot:1587171-Pyramimonas_sp.AAC.1